MEETRVYISCIIFRYLILVATDTNGSVKNQRISAPHDVEMSHFGFNGCLSRSVMSNEKNGSAELGRLVVLSDWQEDPGIA